MLYVAQTALELGFQYALVAMALFLSYRVLDIADLTTDGCFVLGCAVSVTLTAAGHPFLAIPAAMLAGACAGFVTAFLQTKLGVPSILAGIVTNTGLYTINLMAMGWRSNESLLGSDTVFTLLRSTGLGGDWYELVLAAAVTLLCAGLLALFLIAVNTGSLKVTPLELFKGLFIEYNENVATIYDLRFPRILIAIFGGAATAVSGVLLQAVMKNPLADPGIIGVSSGASLTAVLITAFVPTLYFFTPLFAFIGGMIAFLLVYSLSWKGGLSPLRIILVGVAVNAMFTGLMSAFNSGTGSNYSGVASIVNANITMKTWDDFQTLLLYVVIGLIASIFVLGQCNLLALEDKTARSLGVNVTRSRIIISVIAVLLASISTAVIGPISFLGLIVPHIARLLVGSNHKVLVPYSILLGAFTLLLADTLGRTIAAPYEISAAIIMSVVGGPFFILLLRRSKQSYGQ